MTHQAIDIDLFSVVTRSIAESDNLEIVATHLSQLIVGALGIRGCVLFAVNPVTDELEPVASFGLSIGYLNKGPVLGEKSIRQTLAGEAVVISDTTDTDRLQYPEAARQEGIGAIVSLPVVFRGKVIGALRLYHGDTWDPPEPDIQSLQLLADIIALVMMYTRMKTALVDIRATVESVHHIWLD